MAELKQETFVCLDCEFTGLDLTQHRVIEAAVVKFTFSQTLAEFESLVDPEMPIPEESIAIHHIDSAMVQGKPKIASILPTILEIMGDHIIVGHGISHDIEALSKAAHEAKIPCRLVYNRVIDTLRLARYYGDSPINSLESLAAHFNVPREGAHRAMNDVKMNIDVFKHLVSRFKTTEQVFGILSKPIKMKYIPFGKYKGRLFSEIPLDYLQWLAKMAFDQDLQFTLQSEMNDRKRGGKFSQATNPFSNL
jgi:DNA polymerase-3 subunit epsilon